MVAVVQMVLFQSEFVEPQLSETESEQAATVAAGVLATTVRMFNMKIK